MSTPVALRGSNRSDCDQIDWAGILILNADDWGRNAKTTDRTLECIRRGAISSVSAMVFMEDSERAADTALSGSIDVGLHLNLTAPFTAPRCSARLMENQQQVAAYLLRHRFSRVIFHPGLVRSFEYVVLCQIEEFYRLYGAEPRRIDGHHHTHLSSNVLFQHLLPRGTVARRNFTFQPGEKGLSNRLYRQLVDGVLARRHLLVDCLFSIDPLDEPGRLLKIFSWAKRFIVEVETHPVNEDEYRFLSQGEIFRFTGDLKIAQRFALAGP